MPIFLGMPFRVIFLPQFHPLELQEVPKAWATRMNFHEPPGWLNDGTPPGGHGSEKNTWLGGLKMDTHPKPAIIFWDAIWMI